ITPKTLRLAAEAGDIEGVHPLPDGPWIFSRSKLATPQARQILCHPAGSPPDQENLFPSMT
ncbi:transposase, partial [Rhizobium leguminosarum]|nr:transposase [Rhizobium leguminosarum]